MKSPHQWPTASKVLILVLTILPGILPSLQTNAQIVREPDPSIVVSRSMGNIMLVTPVKGSLYIDDFLMTELKGNDTIFLINVRPSQHIIKFLTGVDSASQELILPSAGCVHLIVMPGRIMVSDSSFNYNQIREMFMGKRLLFRDKAWYNVTRFTLLTMPLNGWKADNSGRWQTTIGTINGFQVAPGFSTGIGIAYARRDINYQTTGFYNTSFMPVFLDIRSHFTGKKVAPFLSFDLGYNFLLSGKKIISDGYDTELRRGRICFASGIGLRIALNHLVQIIASLEYHYEGYLLRRTDYYYGPYDVKMNMSSMMICLGIGFQK